MSALWFGDGRVSAKRSLWPCSDEWLLSELVLTLIVWASRQTGVGSSTFMFANERKSGLYGVVEVVASASKPDMR
jgi:hypothetical protein